jgi:nicotinamide phosphoribosyltransferase
LKRLMEMGYATTNLVIGVGGILRNWTRDTLGFAVKATYVEVGGSPRAIEKDPITDHKKKSHKGLLSLTWDDEHKYVTHDECTPEEEDNTMLKVIYRDGVVLKTYALDEIRKRARYEKVF